MSPIELKIILIPTTYIELLYIELIYKELTYIELTTATGQGGDLSPKF